MCQLRPSSCAPVYTCKLILRALFVLSNSYEAWHGWLGNRIPSHVLEAVTRRNNDEGKKEVWVSLGREDLFLIYHWSCPMRSLLVGLAFHRLMLHSSIFCVFIVTRKMSLEGMRSWESMLYFLKAVLPESSFRRANSRVWRHPKIKVHLSPSTPRASLPSWGCGLITITPFVSWEPSFKGLPPSWHHIENYALFLKGSQDSHSSHMEMSSPIQKAGTTLAYRLWV